MARKSRKETVVLPAPEIDATCRAGIYVRLSVEDKHTHTASIETQQLIIARYLEQNPEIIVVQGLQLSPNSWNSIKCCPRMHSISRKIAS